MSARSTVRILSSLLEADEEDFKVVYELPDMRMVRKGRRVIAQHPYEGDKAGTIMDVWPDHDIAMVQWDDDPMYQGTVRISQIKSLLPEVEDGG